MISSARKYEHINPFEEWRVAELQIQLLKAQSQIETLELLLTKAKIKEDLLKESGGTIDVTKYFKLST